MEDKGAPVSHESSQSEPQKESESKASIIFMVFGLLLIFAALVLFQTHTDQATLSSVRPRNFQKDPEASVEYERDMLGIRINNERISAEVSKQRQMLNLGNKNLMTSEPQDPMAKGVPLSQEPNVLGNLHEKSKNENAQNPDVLIPHEVELDREAYEYAIKQQQKDKRLFLEDLQQKAQQQNLDMQYDAKTGEITIDRKPQNAQDSQPGSSK